MLSSLDLTILTTHPHALPISQFLSAWTNVLVALPSFVAFIQWRKRRAAVIILLVLGVFAWFFEAQSILTGWPYSGFQYGNIITGKIAGLVPWTVPFAWTPLLLGCFWIASRIQSLNSRPLARILATALLMVATDLVLDPVATKLGFWHWQQGGWFYGVPLQNFLGWLVSGSLGATILHFGMRKNNFRLAPKTILLGWLLHIGIWTILAWLLRLWIPAGIGTCLLVLSHLLLKRQHD